MQTTSPAAVDLYWIPLVMSAPAVTIDAGAALTARGSSADDVVIACALREQRWCRCYSPVAVAAASANGLPSESRHTAHRSPGWMIEPPSLQTRSTVVARSATVK